MQFFYGLALYLGVLLQCTYAKTVVIAHRGASGYLPEHTLESKVAAFLMGSDYIEQDVVLTKDDVPIVLHDIYLDTITDVSLKFGPTRSRNDSHYYVIDFTFDEIKTLNVTERFKSLSELQEPVYPKRFPLWSSSFKIHSLREEIELLHGLQKSMLASTYSNRRIGFYVELKKPYFHRINNKTELSEIVLNVLDKFGYKNEQDPIYVQCFDPFELKKIRKELKSKLKLVQLLQSTEYEVEEPYIDYAYWNSQDGLKNISTFAVGIGPEKDQLIVLDSNKQYAKPSDLLTQARELNLQIHPYTFRQDRLPVYAKTFVELLNIFVHQLKVDGLFTDFPDLAIDFVHRSSKASLVHVTSNLFITVCSLVVLILVFEF